MSRMIHSGDISYSSINAPNYHHNRNDSGACFRTCFLNFPYATITSTFLVISGLIISTISVLHLAGVLDRLAQDLFYRRYLWVYELRVALWFATGVVSLIVLTNLIIGFATSSSNLKSKSNKNNCSCTRNSTTNCLIRFVFFLNELVYITVLLLLVLFCIFTFVLYLLTTSCTYQEERHPNEALLSHDRSFESTYSVNTINLQPFASLLFMSANETHLLVFKENRLKTLCRTYVSTLKLYNLIALLGIGLLYIGFHCYLINLTVNRIRISTYKKYTELLYLNGTEMNTFHETSYDTGDRF